ncbi:hypothetical protein LX32DRAFT_635605 [Colletotrichum zoysiae]|uniref:Hydrophobin n=1 Tax=Colletotrichum zoysiae TaxID=1216348 RepID=A0AAD9HQ12_9PEZI|nr:hypothetical protein LX32DRAFT_635605 [Colletotrichum zoysiae]
MRVLSTFLFAPAVLAWCGSNCYPSDNGPGVFQAIVPVTGQICCDPNGSPDPTGTCKGKNLNSYCCTSYANDGTDRIAGCDDLLRFKTGRNVLATAGNADVCAYTNKAGNVMTGFIGCAA